MKDHNGNVWKTEPCRKDWNMACTTVLHMGRKRASFIEILCREMDGRLYEVRREYTCVPCHMALLVAGKKLVGG